MRTAARQWLSIAFAIALVGAFGFALPVHARAQDDDEASEGDDSGGDGADESAEDGADEQGEGGDDSGEAKDDDASEADAAAAAPRSWYFGPYFRYAFVPYFGLFLDESPTIANPAFGVTATHRSVDSASLELGIGYTSLSFSGALRAPGDPLVDTEWAESNLGMVHLTGSVMWHSDLVDKLSFEYGVGLDFGITTGQVVRTEAYPSGSGYAPCLGPLNPPAASAYCELPSNPLAGTDAYNKAGAHYGVVEERVPPIFANVMLPHLALRYEPIPDLAVKFEAALGFPEIWFGLSAAYGPKF